MGQAFAPVFRQQLALAGKDFDVGNLVEGDDVRLQPLQDGSRLFGGAGVRLLNLGRVGMFFFVERVVAGEQLARDVVGGVEQFFVGGDRWQGKRQQRGKQGFFHENTPVRKCGIVGHRPAAG